MNRSFSGRKGADILGRKEGLVLPWRDPYGLHISGGLAAGQASEQTTPNAHREDGETEAQRGSWLAQDRTTVELHWETGSPASVLGLLSTVQDWPPGFWGMAPSWHLHVGLREDVPMKSWWGVAQDLGRQKRVAAFVH